MFYLTLTPAYGRDYKSKAAAVADFESGKDFIVADFDSPYSGKPASKADLTACGFDTVNIRYHNNTRVAVVKLS